jgi:uncharacterized protein YndB with AHSA1/START domain/uncharacterized glyoxalase superfamily protein PhnB
MLKPKNTAGNFSLSLDRTFSAPRERVFRAWTNPDSLQKWFNPNPSYSTPRAEVDLRVGGRYKITMRSAEGNESTVSGSYREIKTPEKLVFTWSWEGEDSEETLVTITFSEIRGKTVVNLSHAGFPDQETCEKHQWGWEGCLENFKNTLESETKNEPRHDNWLSPYLTVRDVASAIDFYQSALGFEKLVIINDPSGKPVHAEMRHKTAIVMLGTHPDQTTGSKSPADLGGTSVRLYLYTDDVDALVDRASKGGGVVLEKPSDQYWGDRTGSVRDPEGHVWWMATRLKNVAIEEAVTKSPFTLGS